MGVDHRRFHAGVTQEFLHGANIVAGREQVGGKRMAQGMGGRPLADARALDRVAKCPRDRTFMQVPADPLVSPRVDALARIGCDCVQWPTIKGARPPGGWGGAIEGIGGLGGQELASKPTRRRAGVSGTQRKSGALGMRDRDCLSKDGQRLLGAAGSGDLAKAGSFFSRRELAQDPGGLRPLVASDLGLR